MEAPPRGSFLTGEGVRGAQELPERIHVWMVHEGMRVLACACVCAHMCACTWAAAAAAEEGIVSPDYN